MEKHMEEDYGVQQQVLEALEQRSPGAPFLALGQTVFWDEPMKAGVLLKARQLGFDRKFIAGVHDTDYFAKVPGRSTGSGYVALGHNDVSTRGLWSAAAEFSALFGSETVVSRDLLASCGVKVSRLLHERPGRLDELTEAFGWKGVVSLDNESRTIFETPLGPLFGTLFDTLRWAIELSIRQVACKSAEHSRTHAEQLLDLVCGVAGESEGATLSQFYRRLLPEMYSFVAGKRLEIDTTTTSELLRFHTGTCDLPRFALVDAFLNPHTREQAARAYNDVVRKTDIYTLDRFGVGAVPFDLVIPGVGRGTLRVGTRGAVVMTPSPVGFSFKKPVRDVRQLAAAVEARFGTGCVLVGKALTMIGMLAAEHVFVFHEGASSYVGTSRKLFRALRELGAPLSLHPILRVRMDAWTSMGSCCMFLKLPEDLKRPFGAEEVSAASFARRWREVGQEQAAMLADLKKLQRPLDLLRFLAQRLRGCWSELASEYEHTQSQMAHMLGELASIRAERQTVIQKGKALVLARTEAERRLGEHWRLAIFEKDPQPSDWDERTRLQAELQRVKDDQAEARTEWQALLARQQGLVGSPEARRLHERRKAIALEAELMRVRLVREAALSSEGLVQSSRRPSAWWFPVLCRDGSWLERTSDAAQYYLEPLD